MSVCEVSTPPFPVSVLTLFKYFIPKSLKHSYHFMFMTFRAHFPDDMNCRRQPKRSFYWFPELFEIEF